MVTIRTMKWDIKLDRKSEVMVNVSSILTTSTTNKIRLSLDNIYVTNEAIASEVAGKSVENLIGFTNEQRDLVWNDYYNTTELCG